MMIVFFFCSRPSRTWGCIQMATHHYTVVNGCFGFGVGVLEHVAYLFACGCAEDWRNGFQSIDNAASQNLRSLARESVDTLDYPLPSIIVVILPFDFRVFSFCFVF